MEIKRCYDTIIGASVGENQLVQSGATSVTVQSGHKYYSKINGTESLGASTGSAISINDSAEDMVIDLTQMLGSAIADYVYGLGANGIAKLRSWGFLRGYQAYNAGSIESVEVTGKVVRGFNQVDASTAKDNTYVTGSTGVEVSNDEFACTGYVKCMPSTAYYTNADTNVRIATIVFFDADKNPAGYASASNAVFTTPANAYYIRANVIKARMSVSELVINLSSDRNGEYEPYTERTYDYGDDTLRGIFKLDANNNLYADGDVKTSDGTITRNCAEATITIDSIYVRSGNPNCDYGLFNVSQLWNTDEAKAYVFGEKGITRGARGFNAIVETGKVLPYSSSSLTFAISVPKGATLAEAKALFDTATIIYNVATPTTETGDPFPSPQVVYPDGTEEYITSNGVPVGHETRYEL